MPVVSAVPVLSAVPAVSSVSSIAPVAAGQHSGPFGTPDWAGMLMPDTPLITIFLRGTLVYVALFFLLRFILRRQSATLGVTDLLVVVLIADAAQNAMADNYRSVPDGILLVAVIIGWAWALDALSYHVRWLERVIRPPALLLVKEGQPLWRNMRKELVTIGELESQMRQQGLESIRQIKEARMESDGSISILTGDGERHRKPEKRSAV